MHTYAGKNTKTDDSSSSFTISSAHQSFAEKQKNLFAELDNAEKNNKRTLECDDNMEVDLRVNKSKDRSLTRSFKRKESMFKRPEAPISKCLPPGRVPNFRLNPKKWTKYTLADVADEDISERGNKKAALSFLKELEDRRGESDEEIMESLPEKITFKKTAIVKRSTEEEEDAGEEKTVCFRSSKVVMPEYVVGQKQRKGRSSRKTKGEWSGRELKLDHLLDDETGEDC